MTGVAKGTGWLPLIHNSDSADAAPGIGGGVRAIWQDGSDLA
jgi:hypothetical protein